AIQNLSFPESEPAGATYLNSFLPPATWKQTSYNHNFRFRYAGIGYKFYPECGDHGGFSAPPEFDYFVFDVSRCAWIPPVPYPTDGNDYYWEDAKRSWVKAPSLTVIG
ncbi:hypothetical protein EBT31_21445, partial [bacterium]|nr:hypothetical protein [bacterium]